MYLRQVHTRAGRIWRVHDEEELQEISVHLFLGISLSYSSHFVPFPLSLGEEKFQKNTVKSLSQAMYIGVLLSRKVCTECMEMDIFPESCRASDHISHLD